MRVAVHGRLRFDTDRPRLNAILKMIQENFQDVCFTEDLAEMSEVSSETVIVDKTLQKGQFDVLVSVGGDGTILESVRKVGRSGIPILGVNTGRLGFLASTPFEQLEQALMCLRTNSFQVDHRTLIKAETPENLFGKKNFALNEVSVHKSATSSMLVVKVYLDDYFLSTYWADGLIVATPTGSTGYSLSTGGPIISPSTNNFIISPIAPHNLNVRPLVISDRTTVRIEIQENDPDYLISLDSQSRVVRSDTQLHVSKADFTVGLIRFSENDYFDTLRSKLMWGHDRRN